MEKITVQELKKAIDAGTSAQIVDVRTPSEYISERLEAAMSVPLTHFDQLAMSLDKSRDVYVMCRSGRRAEEFCQRMDALGYRTFCVDGGLQAWLKQDFPVLRTPGQPWSLERQTRFAIGLLVLVGVLLALTVHPGFIYLCGFIGLGLMYAGATDFCGMSLLLARLPWNKPRESMQQASR
ncbi:MAG: rhodanese-like domain-containing protein [Chromatiales bacterium]|nr:rhodanese-like domain-containing protein [Chromatiales bacterium]